MKKYILQIATAVLLTGYSQSLFSQGHQVTDIDGNYYNIVTIGSQIWMLENLKVKQYNDGTPIQLVTDPNEWQNSTTPRYCWYNNDEATYNDTYGVLYNLGKNNYPDQLPYWYKNVCPVGWRVPTYSDFYTLLNLYGGTLEAAGKLKETGTAHWISPNTGATNESGFTALPGGHRGNDGTFSSIGEEGYWWTSSIESPSSSFDIYYLQNNNNEVFSRMSSTEGNSVRCIQAGGTLFTTPSVNTIIASSITPTTAQSGGNVTDDGSSTVTARGVCWSTTSHPTILDNHTTDGTGTGSFTSSLTGLSPNTLYYIKAYATNSTGTAYGDTARFSTYKSDAITDIEGNYYNIVTIGSQVWMAENLKTITLNNGTLIPLVTVGLSWKILVTPGYCWYNNEEVPNKDTYGALYNWYAVNTRILCPSGWHVPSDVEWTIMTNFLGGLGEAGGHLKEKGTSHWDDPNLGDNGSGFTARPGGERNADGPFININGGGYWWSTTESPGPEPFDRYIANNLTNIFIGTNGKAVGESVRCLKDYPKPTIVTNINDDGIGSLRYALDYANSTIGVKDTITFNIPGAGPFAIQLISPLPVITDPVIIDGLSQPGASANGSVLEIGIDGTKAGPASNGLTIAANNCTVQGLIINQFSGSGIQVSNGTGNLINSNSIYSNGGLGINLGSDGATPNDNGDGDTGPSNLQNYPVLTTVSFSTGSVTISGTLNSEASKNYNLQFFASKIADDSGFGEGQTYLGSKSVSTDAAGNASFNESFSIKGTSGTVITATATDPVGNTSEFSKTIGGLQDQTVPQWPLRYTLNKDGVPNITDGSDLSAVRTSFQSWSAISTANIQFTDAGTTTAKYANAGDGVNLVSFEDDQFPFSYGVLAVAAKTWKVDQTTQVAQIIDADIVVNPDFVNDIKYNLGVGYNNKNAGYFDIQSVITHEIGHILGLLHSGVVNSTMFFTLGKGITVRSLEQDDKSWASYRYPKQPGYNSTYGSLSGNIKYGYDNLPVAGALVFAINTATKDSIHAYSDANGDYLVPGLIPGTYNIYIEPLDGTVNGYNIRPGNISSYIYSNTVYTDYPDEFYSGSSESSTETTDLKTSVNVSAGVTTQNINLLTNKDITPPFVVKVRATDRSGSQINILSNFSIRFSEPVDETSLTASCYLTTGTKTIGGSYTTLGDSVNVIVFDPESVLDYSTEYTLHITGGVKDLKGNYLQPAFTKSFSTVPKDNVPPKINEVIPANNTQKVFVTDKIRVFFSEPMSKITVENGFKLSSAATTTGGSFTWDSENTSVTFAPSGSLKEGSTYTLLMPNSITDLSGNQMTSSKSYSFSTVTQAAPTITYLGPGDLTTGVPIATAVVVDFSEPINTFTVNSGTFKLLLGNNPPSGANPLPGTFGFLNDNSRVIFRPGADLAFNQTYTIKLTNGIQDVSTTSMKFIGSTTTFTTAAKTTVPDITYLDPSSGVVGAAVTIAGIGFDPNPLKNVITFNGINAPVKKATLTSLTTQVPLGALSGPVAISVNGTAADNTMFFYIIPQSLDPCSDVVANTSTGTKSTHGVDVTPDGAYAYITNPDEGTVTAVSFNNLQSASVTVGNTPMKIDINPLGSRAYVTNFNSHSVSVIDLVKNSSTYNKVVETIAVGIEPYGIKVTPDGKRVYVANYYSGTLSVINVDPSSGGFDQVVANVNTGTKTGNVAVTPDGAMVLVTGDFGLKIINSNPADKDYNSVIANVSTGTKTKDVAVSPDAGLAIVTTEEGNLLVINLKPENGDYSEAVIANVSTGTKVSDVKVSGDGLFVYVTDTDHDQILVYNIGVGGNGTTNGSAVSGLTLIPHNTIPVGNAPEGLVINTKADRLYVIDTKVSTGNREVTTIAICCGPISPSKSIGDLIITVQNMINNGDITKLRGIALIITLNSALRDIYAGRTKLATADLTAFTALVNTFIKNKQISSAQGKALVSSANAIINQIKGTKSALAESYLADTEQMNQDVLSVSKLGTIYPNPFSQTITVNYEIAQNKEALTKVQIVIYDENGRLINTLVDQMMQSGCYTTSWEGDNGIGSPALYGTYFVLFRAGRVKEVSKIVLIKPR